MPATDEPVIDATISYRCRDYSFILTPMSAAIEMSPKRPCVHVDQASPAAAATSIVWQAIRPIEACYPGFGSWYWGNVVPGLASGRRQFFLTMDDRGLSGLVIAKRDEELKLCTVWVAPRARRQGLATQLVSEAMEWLGTEQPLMTVPAGQAPMFRGLLGAWDFRHEQTLPGYYRQGSTELVFNGCLRRSLHA